MLEYNYEEIISSCRSQAQGTFHRNIYSSRSDMFLIVYWYKGSGTVSLNFTAEATECQSVHLDPCIIHNYCNQNHNKLCQDYLAHKSSNVFSLEQDPKNFKHFNFSLPTNTCLVIQVSSKAIFRKVNKVHSGYCQLHLKDKFLPSLQSAVDYHVMVSLPPTLNPMATFFMPEPLVDTIFLRKSNKHLSHDIYFDQQLEADMSVEISTKTNPTGLPNLMEFLFLIAPEYYSAVWAEIQVKFSGALGTAVPASLPRGTMRIPLRPGAQLGSFSAPHFRLFFPNPKQTHSKKQRSDLSIASLGMGLPGKYLDLPCTRVDMQVCFNEVHEISLPVPTMTMDISELHIPHRKNDDTSVSASAFIQPADPQPQNVTSSKCQPGSSWTHKYKCTSFAQSGVHENHCVLLPKYITGCSVLPKYFFFTLNPKVQNALSWIQASELCVSLGGHLPRIFDRSELGGLISLVRHSEDFSYLEVLFIGLMSNATQQVKTKFVIIMVSSLLYCHVRSWQGLIYLHQFQKFLWEDDSPVAFQQFKNKLFSKRVKYKRVCYIKSDLRISGTLFYLENTADTLQPHFIHKHRCTLMLLFNLASPEWIGIDCTKSLVKFIVCSFSGNQTKNSQPFGNPNTLCSPHYIRYKTHCMLVRWVDSEQDSIQAHKRHRKAQFHLEHVKELKFLTENFKVSPLILYISGSASVFEYSAAFNEFQMSSSEKAKPAAGFQVLFFSQLEVQIGRNLFKCKNTFISADKVCDGTQDCDGGSDELFCRCDDVVTSGSKPCAGSLLTKHLFYTKNRTKTFLTNTSLPVRGHVDLCSSHEMVKVKHIFLNDLINDCGAEAEDEPVLKNLLLNRVTFHCKNYSHIPCVEGHPKCYSVSDMCTYRLDFYKHILPCRNGGHLENCLLFDCNGMFKCPSYYCIPWEYVCDGNWDCPKGDDESRFCTSFSCDNLFKCTHRNVRCVSLGTVCDGVKNCPDGEDEHFCVLNSVSCPTLCKCLLFSVFCIHAVVPNQYQLDSALFLTLINTSVPTENFQRKKGTLYFSLVSMPDPLSCDSLCEEILVMLYMRQNVFVALEPFCFGLSLFLKNIQLSANNIFRLEKYSLANLSALHCLNLSHNPLTLVPRTAFSNTTNLKVFSLYGTSLTSYNVGSFAHLTLEMFETSDHHLCCLLSPHTVCSDKKPWYVCSSNLLPNPAMTVSFISVSMLIFCLNFSFVAIIVTSNSEMNNSNSTIMISICTIEIFCGVYLCIVWVNDIVFRGHFLLQEELWRSSLRCHTASSFLLLFSCLDPLLLVFFSLTRFMVVKHPLKSKFKNSNYILICICSVVLISALFTLIIALLFATTIKTFPSSLCSPFLDPTKCVLLPKVLTVIVTLLQLSASISILLCHVLLIQELKKSTERVRKHKSHRHSGTMRNVQLVTLTISNIICWIPTNIIYLVSLFAAEYPSELVTWTAVTVAPLNCLVNPTVFVVSMVRTMWHQRAKPCE